MLVLTGACIEPPVPPTNEESSEEQVQIEPVTQLAEMDVNTARAIVWNADFKAYEALTDAEKEHNREIEMALQRNRLAIITANLPEWVKDQIIEFESGFSYGFAYSRSVSWGTGQYDGQPFYWFGRTNSDGWLQVDMSIELEEEDVWSFTDAEMVDGRMVPTKELPIEFTIVDEDAESRDYYGSGTKTHIGLSGGVSWPDEFCTKPNGRSPCDTAGALEKYLLKEANNALPGRLSFSVGGRFF